MEGIIGVVKNSVGIEMENVRYQFEFQISEKDYIDFNYYVHKIITKRAEWFLRTVFILLFLLMLPILGSWFSYFLLLSYAVVLILSFAGVWLRWTVNLSIRGLKKRGRLPYGKKYNLQFQEDFVFETEDETETKYPYTKIEKVKINKDVMYIFVSVMQAHIIPLSVFETEEQQNEFMTFINHKIDTLENI